MTMKLKHFDKGIKNLSAFFLQKYSLKNILNHITFFIIIKVFDYVILLNLASDEKEYIERFANPFPAAVKGMFCYYFFFVIFYDIQVYPSSTLIDVGHRRFPLF